MLDVQEKTKKKLATKEAEEEEDEKTKKTAVKRKAAPKKDKTAKPGEKEAKDFRPPR